MDEAKNSEIKQPEKPKRTWIWWIGTALLLFILVVVIFALVKSNTISVKDIGWALLVLFILTIIGLAVYFLVKYLKEKNKPIVTEKTKIPKREAKIIIQEYMKKEHFVWLDIKDAEIDAIRNIGRENQKKVPIYHLRTRDISTGVYWDVLMRLDNPEDMTELKDSSQEDVFTALNQLADFKEPENTIIQESKDPISGEVTRTITQPSFTREPTQKEEEEPEI